MDGKEKAIEVLETTVKSAGKRNTDLLRDPLSEGNAGWFFSVPSCFNDALDIKKTERVTAGQKNQVWTQGTCFSFSPGDTLYDTPEAYRVWREALAKISICVQVQATLAAQPQQEGDGRLAGRVDFAVYKPNEELNSLVLSSHHSMSQEDFVRFLIVGPDKTPNL